MFLTCITFIYLHHYYLIVGIRTQKLSENQKLTMFVYKIANLLSDYSVPVTS